MAGFKHPELNIIAPIAHGKTEHMSYARTAWEIGIDTSQRHILASNTAEQALRTLRAVRELIEFSDDYKRVFPNVKPSPRGPWSDRAFTVERKNLGDRNPTVQAVGLMGAILGARANRVRMDDMDDLESTWTGAQRSKAQTWIRTNLLSRLVSGGSFTNVATAWHPEDWTHTLRRQGVPTYVYRIRRPDGTFLWPAGWDAAREASMRRLLGETAAARMLDSIPRTGDLQRIKDEWIQVALKNGLGRPLYQQAMAAPNCQFFIGVDLAVSQGQDSDLCAFAVILVEPNGNRHLVHIESGRYSGPDIVRKIKDHAKRYPNAMIVVENNAAQDYIRQFASEEVAGIVPYTTGRAKADPRFGIESVATEMAHGKWWLPCTKVSSELPLVYEAEPEVRELVGELLDYSPSAHTGDRLMALWLAREGIARGAGVVETVELHR